VGSEPGACDPVWAPVGEEKADGAWVGLDAEGRALLREARRSWGNPVPPTVRVYGDGYVDAVSGDGRRRAMLADGRVVLVVEANEGDVSVERWTRRDGVPVHGDFCVVNPEYTFTEAYSAERAGRTPCRSTTRYLDG
jgi:hypothetical protein